jgi:hypothetical protein
LEDSHAFCNRHIWLQSPYPSTKTPSLTLHSLSSFCAAGKTCLSYHSTFLPFFFLSSLCVAGIACLSDHSTIFISLFVFLLSMWQVKPASAITAPFFTSLFLFFLSVWQI